MAGGVGARIAKFSQQLMGRVLPKPMLPIDGMPVLEREIYCLRDQGFTELIITVGYLADSIIDYFGDGSKISPVTGKSFGAKIEYFRENVPLGNAGALLKLRKQGKLTEDFLLLNADAIFDIDFQRFVTFHQQHAGLVTLFTHPNSHPFDSGLVVTNSNGVVQKWLTKEDIRPKWYWNRVNAGLHVLNVAALDFLKIDVTTLGKKNNQTGKLVKVDLDRHILKPLCGKVQSNGNGMVYAYDSPEYVKDMGTPERFLSVEQDFVQGIVSAKNLSHHQKAVFLDRDGTINKYRGFLSKIDEFELLPYVAEAVRRLNESGFLVIVITNQPVIARGELTFEQLEEIHCKMTTLLGLKGAYIDGIYICPHHPDKGFAGEVSNLKIDCTCRKPKPGLILKALADFHIDAGKSWMVGDSACDIKCGNNAGCHTALIMGAESDVNDEKDLNGENANLVCGNLKEFCDLLLRGE